MFQLHLLCFSIYNYFLLTGPSPSILPKAITSDAPLRNVLSSSLSYSYFNSIPSVISVTTLLQHCHQKCFWLLFQSFEKLLHELFQSCTISCTFPIMDFFLCAFRSSLYFIWEPATAESGSNVSVFRNRSQYFRNRSESGLQTVVHAR